MQGTKERKYSLPFSVFLSKLFRIGVDITSRYGGQRRWLKNIIRYFPYASKRVVIIYNGGRIVNSKEISWLKFCYQNIDFQQSENRHDI